MERNASAEEERLVHEAADGRHCKAAVLELLQLVLLADLRRLGREFHRVETKVARFVAVLVHVLHGHLTLGGERDDPGFTGVPGGAEYRGCLGKSYASLFQLASGSSCEDDVLQGEKVLEDVTTGGIFRADHSFGNWI